MHVELQLLMECGTSGKLIPAFSVIDLSFFVTDKTNIVVYFWIFNLIIFRMRTITWINFFLITINERRVKFDVFSYVAPPLFSYVR